MNQRQKKPVVSRVVGVVHTDIVVYILPGFFLGLCVLIMSNYLDDFFDIISNESFASTIGFIIGILAVSYILGLLISFIRWFVYPYRKSIGDILFGNLKSRNLKRMQITKSFQDLLIKKINADIEKLGWISEEDNKRGPEEKNRKSNNQSKYSKKDYNLFGALLLNSLRESGLYIHDYYERWDDLDASRKNMVISIQLILLILCIKIAFFSNFLILIRLFICGSLVILVVLLVLSYLFVISELSLRHLRLILLYYLSGRLKILEE